MVVTIQHGEVVRLVLVWVMVFLWYSTVSPNNTKLPFYEQNSKMQNCSKVLRVYERFIIFLSGI